MEQNQADCKAFLQLTSSGGYQNAIDHFSNPNKLWGTFLCGEPTRTLLELQLATIAGNIRDRVRWWEIIDQHEIVTELHGEVVQLLSSWRVQHDAQMAKIVQAYEDLADDMSIADDISSAEDQDMLKDGDNIDDGDRGIGSTCTWKKSVIRNSHEDPKRYGQAENDGIDTSNMTLEDEATVKLEYALKECKWGSHEFRGPVKPASADGVFCRDDVADSLITRLLAGCDCIRSREQRSVYPVSNGLVIDFIDPSMYAYHKGVTPVTLGANVFKMPQFDDFACDYSAKPDEKPDQDIDTYMCSAKGLAWLPAEFFVDDDGSSTCNINSYINSLHPERYSDIYATIGDAFTFVLPLLEHVLGELGTPGHQYYRPKRVSDEYYWRGPEIPSCAPKDYWREFLFRDLYLPKVPKDFIPPPHRPAVRLRGKNLQVIVKLESIELTPEKQKYPGRSWHVEGRKNERIVATACMYLEKENCTTTLLAFRSAVTRPWFEPNDDVGVAAMYGLIDGEPLVQNRGESRMIRGRVLAWPNTIQSRVPEFELADKTRPGRLTFLYFFLVDPTLRIRSTATVPPQCFEWKVDAMTRLLNRNMPRDVIPRIISLLGGMTYADACERRNELIEERKTRNHLDKNSNHVFFERLFSLYEQIPLMEE